MSKKRKNRSRKGSPGAAKAVEQAFTRAGVKIPAKKMLGVFISFVLVFAVFILIIKLEWMPGVYIFYTATGLLLIAVFVLNGGFSKDIPDKTQLRDSWSDQKKENFINTLKTGKKWAKRLMYPLLPMLIAVMIDIIYLFWFA